MAIYSFPVGNAVDQMLTKLRDFPPLLFIPLWAVWWSWVACVSVRKLCFNQLMWQRWEQSCASALNDPSFVVYREGAPRLCSLMLSIRWKTATTLHLFRESPASVFPHTHTLWHTRSCWKELCCGPLCIARREQTVAFQQSLTGRWKGQRYLLYFARLCVCCESAR